MNQFNTRLRFVFFLAWIVLLIPASSFSDCETMSPKHALKRLMHGNHRYVNSETVCHADWTAKRTALIRSQNPFAIIVSCSDSRVPPEIIFDQTLGDLFVVRVAGNIVDDFAIGSIEYGVSVLGANLVLVLGHSNCGAVDAALKGLKFDNHIQSVLTAIQPAVQSTRGESENRLENTIKANVRNVEETLKRSKPVLANLIEKGSLKIIGGYYDLESGKVEFLENHKRPHEYSEN